MSVKGYTLLSDRLFVLWHEVCLITSSEMYCRQIRPLTLSEHQGQKKSPYWVKVRDHDCISDAGSPFQGLNLLTVFGGAVLHSYGDCLVITAEKYAILHDLSTFESRQIPAMPEDEEEDSCIHAAVCELQDRKNLRTCFEFLPNCCYLSLKCDRVEVQTSFDPTILF